MSKSNVLKKFCKEILSEYCPQVYYGQCSAGVFPRIEFDFKQINVNDEPYFKYLVTLNLYDRQTSVTIDEIADRFCSESGRGLYSYEDLYELKLYTGDDRQAITEADKSIHHIMMSFEVRMFKRSDII